MRHWFVLVLFLLGLGTLRLVACGDESCVEDEDCNDGDPCTSDGCPEPPLFDFDFSLCGGDEGQTCQHSRRADGTPCGSGKVCVAGVCEENLCEGVVCDDGLDCTDDECVFMDGGCRFTSTCDDGDPCTEDICSSVTGLCDYTTPAEEGTPCVYQHENSLVGVGIGICEAGVCVASCDPASEEVLPCTIPSRTDLLCCPGCSSCQGRDDCQLCKPDATCSAWCTVDAECMGGSFSECMRFCHEELLAAQSVSTECADAVRNQNLCLAELTCAEYDAWFNEVPPDAYPCKSADDAVISICL